VISLVALGPEKGFNLSNMILDFVSEQAVSLIIDLGRRRGGRWGKYYFELQYHHLAAVT
jgi:hypothetical protein